MNHQNTFDHIILDYSQQQDAYNKRHNIDYSCDFMYLITILMKSSTSNVKSLRIKNYMDVYKQYYFRLCQDMFNGKIRKSFYKNNRPLAIGFYDQEGTRIGKRHEEELVPHVHAVFCFNEFSNSEFRRTCEKFIDRNVGDRNKKKIYPKFYGINQITEIDIRTITKEPGTVLDYSSKFGKSRDLFRNEANFEVLPLDYKFGVSNFN